MFDWLKARWQSLLDLVNGLWTDLTQFLTDLPKQIFSSVVDAFVSLVELIPVPDFAASGGLQAVAAQLPESVQYFLDQSSMPQALAILAAGVSFKLARKLLTLFQW